MRAPLSRLLADLVRNIKLESKIRMNRKWKHVEKANTVYRKESASDQYMHFSLAQAWQHKVAVIRTLKHRALTYCSNPALLENELSYLLKVFLENGFPNTIQRILRRKQFQILCSMK